VQVARTLNMQPTGIRIRVEARYHREGSVLRGDAATVCDGISTELHFESDAPDERNRHLARMAEASCFTIAALRQPVSCLLAVTVNGTRLELT
jgi:hypothetical protein